jgi:hypothetical protein
MNESSTLMCESMLSRSSCIITSHRSGSRIHTGSSARAPKQQQPAIPCFDLLSNRSPLTAPARTCFDLLSKGFPLSMRHPLYAIYGLASSKPSLRRKTIRNSIEAIRNEVEQNPALQDVVWAVR